MRVHEFEGAMFENEIQYYVHYMGWWAVCGMFVYRDLTSAVTKRALGGRGGSFFDEVKKMFCVFDV